MAQSPINDKTTTINKSVHIVPIHYWILWLAFGVLILAVLVWSIFGSIYTRVDGFGIILPGDKHIYPAASQSGGILLESKVSIGDRVKKGQILAHIDQSSLASKILEKESYLKLLKQQQAKLHDEFQKEQDTLRNYYGKVIGSLEKEMDHADTYRDFLKKMVKARKRMSDEHLVTETSFEKTRQSLYDILAKIYNLNNKILDVKYEKEQEVTSWLRTFNQISLQIAENANELEQMKINHNRYRYVRSPVDGKIISLNASIGEYVKSGQQVFSIVDDSAKQNLIALFDPFEGKKINAGMKAYVSPTFINKYQYGSINAKVHAINKYPISKTAALSQIANQDLVNQLASDSSTLLLSEIQLERNAQDQYSWTSKGKIPYSVTQGSICVVTVEVRKQAPISLLLPIFRKWLDWQK